jgi:hypothetical protein
MPESEGHTRDIGGKLKSVAPYLLRVSAQFLLSGLLNIKLNGANLWPVWVLMKLFDP